MEKGCEDQNHRIIAEAARLEAGELKSSDGKRAKLQQEIIELKKSLESETQAHRESEYSLRKVHTPLEILMIKKIHKLHTYQLSWITIWDSPGYRTTFLVLGQVGVTTLFTSQCG